jgi:hypothetical protein
MEGLLQLLVELFKGLVEAFGFRNYNLWSNAHSASSRQLWSEERSGERQPLQQQQQEQQQQQQQQPQEQEV